MIGPGSVISKKSSTLAGRQDSPWPKPALGTPKRKAEIVRGQADTYRPSESEIEVVQAAYREGLSRAEIAERLQISIDAFDRHRLAGHFGHLPSRRGCNGGRPYHQQPDSEELGRLFGSTDWPARQDAIRRGWTPAEAYDRRRGKLPHDPPRDMGPRLGRAAFPIRAERWR